MFFPLRDLNPRSRFPFATVALIAANVIAYLWGLTLGPDGRHLLALTAGAIPAEVTGFVDIYPRDLVAPPLTILTSMFLHGGLFHLVGNMWFLWIFGDNVEEALGHVRFVIFYLAAGILGAAVQCLAAPYSTIPMIGASGAVAGVLGAYVMLYPHARVETLAFFLIFIQRILVPAWVFLGLWFVGQFFIGEGSGIAWVAHVGGFLTGLGTIRLLVRRIRHRRPAPVDVEYIPPPRRSMRW